MKFGIRHAIAIGIVMLAGVTVFVLRQQGVQDEIWSTAAATGFTLALVTAFGGKCGSCRSRCKDGEAPSAWMPWLF